MDNAFLFVVEIISAVLCFILVIFMVKPYRYTGEGRYIGLPLGFGLLGFSYIFMGLTMVLGQVSFIEDMTWLQLFTQSYAFAFLTVTYYFSRRGHSQKHLLWEIVFTGLIVLAIISCLIVFVPPSFSLPDYKTIDEYFRVVNIVFISYIAIFTLKRAASSIDSKTMWIPLAFTLLGFAQYSSLIWSLDSSNTAFLGAHLLRLMGLLIFLYVAYQTFYKPFRGQPKGEISHEENPA